jgi:hypothetical protein
MAKELGVATESVAEAGRQGRWSAGMKRAAVRLLRGENLETVSR